MQDVISRGINITRIVILTSQAQIIGFKELKQITTMHDNTSLMG